MLNQAQPTINIRHIKMQAHYWQEAIKYLCCKDTKLMSVINQFPHLVLTSKSNAFNTLTRAIVGQQISTQAAASVWLKLTQNVHPFNQNTVLKKTVTDLKALGLSQQKSCYLHNIAHYFRRHNITENYWQNRSYTETKQELISIKGVGVWTVEMFAIFYLLEPDIFPIKDLGLIRAICRIYSPANKTLSSTKIEQLSKNWQPYRTVATWYLWRSIDTKVVEY